MSDVDDAIHAELPQGALLCGLDPRGCRVEAVDDYPEYDIGGMFCWSCLSRLSSYRPSPLASSSPASSGSTVGMEPVVRGLPSPPGSRATDGFDEKETT